MLPFAGYLAVFSAVCLWAWCSGASLVPVVTAPVPLPFLQTTGEILGVNLRALVVLVLGSAATGGLFGLAMFAATGYEFGLLLRALPASVAPWTWLYAPLEVTAFACGATAAMRVFWSGMRALKHGGPWRWRSAVPLLLFSLVGLIVAAILETVAITYGWSAHASLPSSG